MQHDEVYNLEIADAIRFASRASCGVTRANGSLFKIRLERTIFNMWLLGNFEVSAAVLVAAFRAATFL